MCSAASPHKIWVACRLQIERVGSLLQCKSTSSPSPNGKATLWSLSSYFCGNWPIGGIWPVRPFLKVASRTIYSTCMFRTSPTLLLRKNRGISIGHRRCMQHATLCYLLYPAHTKGWTSFADTHSMCCGRRGQNYHSLPWCVIVWLDASRSGGP